MRYCLVAFVLALLLLHQLSENSFGNEPAPASQAVSAAPAPAAEAVPAVRGPPDYCRDFADKAAEARLAVQTRDLEKARSELEVLAKDLDAKRTEYLAWKKGRAADMAKADAGLVAVLSKMKPDAAARQLAQADRVQAAAMLRQLNPRVASAILEEMSPDPAAALTALLLKSAMKGKKP